MIVRLTPEETLTQKSWGSKFDGLAVGFIDWLDEAGHTTGAAPGSGAAWASAMALAEP